MFLSMVFEFLLLSVPFVFCFLIREMMSQSDKKRNHRERLKELEIKELELKLKLTQTEYGHVVQPKQAKYSEQYVGYQEQAM
jgi:hypothetical protein